MKKNKWIQIYLLPFANFCIAFFFVWVALQKIPLDSGKFQGEYKDSFALVYDGFKTVLVFLIGIHFSTLLQSIVDAKSESKLENLEDIASEIKHSLQGPESFELDRLACKIQSARNEPFSELTIFAGFVAEGNREAWTDFKRKAIESNNIKVFYVYVHDNTRSEFMETYKNKQPPKCQFIQIMEAKLLPAPNIVAVKYGDRGDISDYEIYAIFPTYDGQSAICVHTTGEVKRGFYFLVVQYLGRGTKEVPTVAQESPTEPKIRNAAIDNA
jgi:hypothetical protein